MNETELRELIARCYPTVMRVCRSWLSYDDAQDAAQEVFADWLGSPLGFDSPEHELAYFIRAAKHRSIDRLRSLGRERARSLPMSEINEPSSSLTGSPHELELAEADRLERLIAELPPYTKMVLRLHYGEGYEYKELARMLKTTEGRLKMLVSRARSKLRRELTKGEING